jgi:hypothetical protein
VAMGRLLLRTPPPPRVVPVRVCDSRAHELRLATQRLYWIDGPVDYCERCCDMMVHIAEVLGMHPKVEPIPAPAELGETGVRRGMRLEEQL